MFRFPAPLSLGDTIAITAPSSGVPRELHPRLELVIGHLQKQGFNIVEGQCLWQNEAFVSAPAITRAEELTRFLLDDNIAAIVPPYGGELATEILGLLDFEKIAQAKPKWLVGYSDISTLTCAISAKVKWATVHSSCLMEWVPSQQDALTKNVLTHLGTSANSSFTQRASERHEISAHDWKSQPDGPFQLTQDTQWKTLNGKTYMSGRLFGGCLDILMLQMDGPFIDLAAIKQRHPEGTILFLENAELSPTALKRALLAMQHKGLFDDLNGLMFGRHAGVDNDTHGLTYEQVIASCFSDADCPVFYDVDIGHVPPNLTLINGALAHVNIGKEGATIEQTIEGY